MSYSIQPIKAVTDYFGNESIPFIVEEFQPGRGWVHQTFRKRVSKSWLRKRYSDGVTWVALEHPDRPNRPVDFRMSELLR